VDCIGDIREALPDDAAFWDLRHRVIWQHLQKAYDEKKSADIVLVMESLRASGELDQVGGLAFLTTLPDNVPSAHNLPSYLDVVKERWQMRRMISACAQTVSELMDSDQTKSVGDLLAGGESRVQAAGELRVTANEQTMKMVVCDVAANVLEKFERGKKFRIGPQTGFNYVDNILPGLAPGQLIVIAARPRTGKSAFIMQTAEHIALVEKEPVAIFSLEMTSRSLGLRQIFQKAGADLTKFLNGFLLEADVNRLTLAAATLAQAPIIIDESPRISLEDLEVRARRMKRKYGTKVFFVDYFQLMFCRNSKQQWSKSDELAYISMRLKALAKELEVPIVLCAQMNRQIEQDFNRRPRLADLKDTGQLEQDADVVAFLWKAPIDMSNDKQRARIQEILAHLSSVPADWRKLDELSDEGKPWKHYLTIVTCTIEKQREGRSGEDAAMVLIRPWVRFVDAYTPPRPPKEKKEAQAEENLPSSQDGQEEQQQQQEELM
jgi:replicative DNA helicase